MDRGIGLELADQCPLSLPPSRHVTSRLAQLPICMKPDAWLCASHHAECLLACKVVIEVQQSFGLVAIVCISEQVSMGNDVIILAGTTGLRAEQAGRYVDILVFVRALRESPI